MTEQIKLPKRISPNPIVGTVVEVRFTPLKELQHDEMLTVFYPAFSSLFPKVKEGAAGALKQKNPIIKFNIPVINPQQFIADYIFSNDDYCVTVGSSGIGFENVTEYNLWENYFPIIKSGLTTLSSLKILKSIDRISLRYISMFENSNQISGTFDLKFDAGYNGYNPNLKSIKLEYTKNDIRLFLQIQGDTQFKRGEKTYKGAYIDIDASRSQNIPQLINNDLFSIIDTLHSEEKNLFFSLLNKDFLKTLKLEF